MSILIRGGMLITMTEKGAFMGDILIRDGMIEAVEEQIDTTQIVVCEVMETAGCVVTPGLVDACVHDCAEEKAYFRSAMLSSGVTTSCIWDETGHPCWLVDSHGFHDADVKLPDGTIQIDPMVDKAPGQGTVGVGSRVIITSRKRSCESPWASAVKLRKQGVPVAVSTGYPAAKQKLLPVCAGLCVRDGMAREDALAAITRDAAAVLGLTDRGRIAPGMRADLTIFDGDPLLLATSLVCTIAGGRIIKHG